jgi:hypothetical protein
MGDMFKIASLPSADMQGRLLVTYYISCFLLFIDPCFSGAARPGLGQNYHATGPILFVRNVIWRPEACVLGIIAVGSFIFEFRASEFAITLTIGPQKNAPGDRARKCGKPTMFRGATWPVMIGWLIGKTI